MRRPRGEIGADPYVVWLECHGSRSLKNRQDDVLVIPEPRQSRLISRTLENRSSTRSASKFLHKHELSLSPAVSFPQLTRDPSQVYPYRAMPKIQLRPTASSSADFAIVANISVGSSPASAVISSWRATRPSRTRLHSLRAPSISS